MTREEFEALAARVIKSLPREFRAAMDNIVVLVKDAPTRAQDREFGPGLYGLYEGVPLPDRSSGYSGAMPDKITLFKNNLEYGVRTERAVAARIRHTLLHELAHYFGMDDEELIRKDLY
ncbi:MAG: metallopeptidase family protein [Elusimicrobiales bacterium]